MSAEDCTSTSATLVRSGGSRHTSPKREEERKVQEEPLLGLEITFVISSSIQEGGGADQEGNVDAAGARGGGGDVAQLRTESLGNV